jgi:hypothetical protein
MAMAMELLEALAMQRGPNCPCFYSSGDAETYAEGSPCFVANAES